MTRKTYFVFAIVMMLSAHGFAEETTPSEILEKTRAAYAAMDTYKTHGTITSYIDTGDMEMNIETSFSIILKKPNLYLISWEQKGMSMPALSQSGAVWSDGAQPYLYMGVMNAYFEMPNDELALASATGISSGAAYTVPSLFLSVFGEQPPSFSRLKGLKIEITEKVEGEDCFVLSGSSAMSKKETLWISKSSYLLRKYSRSLESPEGGTVVPEITDKELEEAIKGMGQEVTEESMKSMKEMLEESRTSLKTMKIKGSTIELHTNVSSPELDRSDFKFVVPKGSVLKESLFGELLGGKPELKQVIPDPAPSLDAPRKL